ncbi:MAG: hypothetical protein L7R66_02780, partial [Candidatus Thalassarchaeaceae archaeon]|nr:hypothetical protein [Candidatus Thalassarchaeaceae archaeon]
IKKHPDFPEMGYREWNMSQNRLFISNDDYSEGKKRLKDFADVEIKGEEAIFISEEKKGGLPVIHWISSDNNSKAKMLIPDGSDIRYEIGLIEDTRVSVGQIIQLERVGLARVEEIDEITGISLIWLHG